MQKGKGDYLSKFYTGGRSGGIIITAMMVSAWAAGLVLAGVSGAVQSSMGGMVVSLAGTVVSDLYKNILVQLQF